MSSKKANSPEWFDYGRFARWVQTERKKQNLNQADFAEVSQRTVTNVEALAKTRKVRNRRNWLPIAETILQIARTLDSRATTFESLRAIMGDDPPLFVEQPPRLTWAGVTVPQCILELDLTELGGFSANGFRIEVVAESVRSAVPESLRPLREQWLSDRIVAAAKSRPLSNDPSFALVRLKTERPRPDGIWRCTYVLEVQPCTYYDFLWPNTCLDQGLVIDGRETTLRQELRLSSVRLGELDQVQVATPKLGAGIVVVTSDRCAVVSMRAPDTAIAPGGYHLSVAEGMLKSDVGNPRRTSPFAVAIRGLSDELGLVADTDRRSNYDYVESDLRCLGIMLDTLRIQPMLFFRLETKLTFTAVYQKWLAAKDRPENKNLLAVRWEREIAKKLVQGEIHGSDSSGELARGRSPKLIVSSNHVQAGFALAAKHDFGPDELDETYRHVEAKVQPPSR